MIKLTVLIATFFGILSSAHADTFICQGTGRFEAIGWPRVELAWKKAPQKVLLDSEILKVQVSLDKSNADGRHYLAIEVLEFGSTGVTSVRGAKGSNRDMVQYFDSASSHVLCLPVGK